MLVLQRHGPAHSLAIIAFASKRAPHLATRSLYPIAVRHASSSKPPSSSSRSWEQHTTRLSTPNSLAQGLNAPESTFPPPLDLPARQPADSSFQYYWALGKAYVTFYKNGFKNTWLNHKASRALKSRVAAQQASDTNATGTAAPNSTSGLAAAAQRGLITRGEWQLARRSARDIKKLPFIVLIALVCGEFTPLVVLAIGSGVTPGPCRIPKQVEGDRRRLEERRDKSFRDATLEVNMAGTEGKEVGDADKESVRWDGLSRKQQLHVGATLGLSGRMWDYIGGLPGPLLRRRALQWEEYVRVDDGLVERGGGFRALNASELQVAAEERGLDVLGIPEGQLRTELESWAKSRRTIGYTSLLLKRPSAW